MKSEKEIEEEMDKALKLLEKYKAKKQFDFANNNKVWYAALEWVLK